MKPLITTLMLILFANYSQAQSSSYDKLWKEVENFENKGLPKSALDIVVQISAKAKKENNDKQHIKSLIYKSKYALTLEEDAQLSIINEFKSEIAKSESPTKNLLESMLANLYWQYFQEHRWQFHNRTTTAETVSDDFRTWDLQTLFDTIHLHYQNSLQNASILQQTPLNDYDELLVTQENSKLFRPTLYDLISHNALSFYKTDENSITKPAYKFQIDNADYLSDAKTFAQLNITSKDSTSLQLHALKIYKNLIDFHQKQPFQLADVDIERLLFVYQHATFDDKDDQLLTTLKASSAEWNAHEVSGLYDFEIASLYRTQGQTYQPKTNEATRWKLKESMALCDVIISRFPNSVAAEKSKALKAQILFTTLNITIENLIPTQQNALALIEYTNFNELNFNIYKLSKSQLETFNNTHREDDQIKFIKNLKTSKTWTSPLKNELDYQTHTTEIVIPKLANGHYLIVASPKMMTEGNFAFKTIQVTNIALVNKTSKDKEFFQVINRTNGQPLVGAKVLLTYQESYNSPKISKTETTDKNGEIAISKTKNRLYNLNIEVQHQNDVAYFNNYYVNRYYGNDNEREVDYKAFLFTERSIYRPGQLVYFKGILMKTDYEKSEVIANQNVDAILYDANSQEVKTLSLKTNEYGSVAGEFVLPSSGLTGQFYIELDAKDFELYSETYFSVEEYKRPKFETKFNPVTETFKVNDSVTVKGTALAYAGSNITNAKVVYRVHRNVQYPSWYFWRRPWFNSEPQEITFGETTTNDKGEFEITFKAIPDDSVDKKGLPVFNYEITADVTDINGETRSANTIVNVGYHAMTASIIVDAKIDKSQKDPKLTIDTKNLNGEFVPAKGSVKIYKLQAPTTVLRPRPWNAPDYQVITKQEFKKMFPNEAYDNEHNPDTWEKGSLVFDKNFDTETSKTLDLGNIKKWDSGQYVIVLESKDKFDQLVKDETKTVLFSDDDKTLADKALFSVTTNKSSFQPNENVVLTFGSSAENMTVTVDVEKNQKVINTYIIPLSNNKKSISIPVTKDDIGGFAVHYSYAVFNSYYSGTETISVPYPTTDLEIETLTFRDKLQPGTDETWSFKIKGPKGDKISAELLASMYDASLDQFQPHTWNFNPIQKPTYYSSMQRNAGRSFGMSGFRVYNAQTYVNFPYQNYDQLNWFGFYFGDMNEYYFRMNRAKLVPSDKVVGGVTNMYLEESAVMDDSIGFVTESKKAIAFRDDDSRSQKEDEEQKEASFDNVQIRKNLQETAFFFPQLLTDAEGNVTFSFTTPEALTQWKLQLLAHTKTLESSLKTLQTVTQKELMVIPNAPRFLRQGDNITISTKIANLTDKTLSGQAVLILTDAISGKDISDKLFTMSSNSLPLGEMPKAERAFTVDAKGNTDISWNLTIPYNVDAVQYKVIAKSGEFSDGEQNALPVLTNRMLVTETLPMWIRSNKSKSFTLDKLKTITSPTLKHHKLTLEMTSNPAWYAVQALPYLMEYPYDCNEQTFSRYYANALASHIANSNPRIQEVFNQWKNTDALISNLEKNEELKSILIQETPWLRDAQSETEQKKRIALLFDLNKMTNELASAKRKLENNQMANGAWAWFEGGKANRYITQHIITGFGHLKQLIVESNQEEMVKKAIQYLDTEFVQEYKDLKKYNAKVDLSKDHLSYSQLHYLYMRSFFPDIEKSKEVKTVTDYYQTQIQKYWLPRPLYAKGLMALVSHRAKDTKTTANILKSLKETSITNDELGMYWKENTASWYWYQAPIETQALMIETFSEINDDVTTVDNLKIWLLKNKQTNQWKTTKATTEAVYALLLQGSDWLSVRDAVDVLVGNQKIEPSKLEDVKVEAGTSYFKTAWNGSEIQPEMATVKLTKKGDGIAWGSLYWQYFEDLDKITTAETPLKLNKKLFLKTNTDKGEVITEITEDSQLKVGDLVRVRIELRSDRDMEFIHMKDMRAAGLEPVNVLSQYKWQDGLGYYEATKDASTNFFFDYLPKGVFVFEYDLRVNNAGNMSNGITTIQSMYAPEFTSHSEGVRIQVD